MNALMTDLWPFLITALFGAIGWQWRENHTLKTKVAVMEKTIEDMLKDIESMKKRQDSHSKKQDEIVNLITEFKFEVIKQFGELSSDIKTLNSTIKVFDNGAMFTKEKKK